MSVGLECLKHPPLVECLSESSDLALGLFLINAFLPGGILSFSHFVVALDGI